jgi:hypothetical protein
MSECQPERKFNGANQFHASFKHLLASGEIIRKKAHQNSTAMKGHWSWGANLLLSLVRLDAAHS